MNFKKRTVDLHVIDAMDSESAANARSEALALRYHLRDTKIDISSHYAWDESSFEKAILRVRDHRAEYRSPREYIPYLHIACHGEPDALIIGDKVPIPWFKLNDLLVPLLEKIDYALPLTLSSCHGVFGYRMALQSLENREKKRPYHFLLGPQGALSSRELILSTSTFYRGLLEERLSLKESVERANQLIEKPTSYLAYTFGSRVLGTFERDGVDDTTLFLQTSGKMN